MSRYNFIGTDVDIITYEELLSECHKWIKDKQSRSRHVACVNVNCVVEAYLNPEVKKLFSKADISGPDSMPFVYWIRLLTKKQCDRLYAPDIILKLGGKSCYRKLQTIFIWGSKRCSGENAVVSRDKISGNQYRRNVLTALPSLIGRRRRQYLQ